MKGKDPERDNDNVETTRLMQRMSLSMKLIQCLGIPYVGDDTGNSQRN